MKELFIRIDDRLIHGQVIMGWTRSLGVTRILVADDKTAVDRVQISLMRMATPAGLESDFLTVDDAAQKIKTGFYASESIMLLAVGPKTIIELLDKGLEISSLNIGNMRSGPGKRKLLNIVYATPQEIEDWKELDRRGVKMSAQSVPDMKKTDFNSILKKKAK
jgi:mannose/fructose/N-acetylgalactosamine-specific phosphotransferase system component IIB